jgi:hypothetical protein
MMSLRLYLLCGETGQINISPASQQIICQSNRHFGFIDVAVQEEGLDELIEAAFEGDF